VRNCFNHAWEKSLFVSIHLRLTQCSGLIILLALMGSTPAQAQDSYEKAAELHNRGVELYSSGNIGDAISLFGAAAELGMSNSHMVLGEIFLSGTRVDYAKARHHFEQAWTIAKESDAAYFLGYIHFEGLGTRADAAEAARWFVRATEDYGQYREAAHFILGTMYLDGDGVKRDEQKAIDLLGIAARTIDDARFNLAAVYINGMGNVEQNFPEGLYHLCKLPDSYEPKRQYMEQQPGIDCQEALTGIPAAARVPNVIEDEDELQHHVITLLSMARSSFSSVRGEPTETRYGDVMSTYPVGSATSFIRRTDAYGFVGHRTRELELANVEYEANVWSQSQRDRVQIQHLRDAIDAVIPRTWIRSDSSPSRASWKECQGSRGHMVEITSHRYEDGGGYADGRPSLNVGTFPESCPGGPNLPRH
jgi:tetratricopeptide (TPR) repeat protein